jgi:hypothetical protein
MASPHTMARTSDPDTSFEAAKDLIDSGKLTDQQTAVLEAIRRWPGLTARDLSAASGLDYYAIQRRAAELATRRQVIRGAKAVPRSGGRPGETLWPVEETQ